MVKKDEGTDHPPLREGQHAPNFQTAAKAAPALFDYHFDHLRSPVGAAQPSRISESSGAKSHPGPPRVKRQALISCLRSPNGAPRQGHGQGVSCALGNSATSL